MAVDRALSGSEALLAVESATARASVALLRGQEVLAVVASEDGRQHSETLLPLVDRVLGEAGLQLDDVVACAVSIGPGAFTSLRIGLATVKGLCFASDRRVVAVPTLEALAAAGRRAGVLPQGTIAIPTLDARRGEVYAAAYVAEATTGRVAPHLEPGVFDAEGLVAALPGGGCLVGEGAQVVGAGLRALAPGVFDCEAGAQVTPDAVDVGLIGAARWAVGEGVEAARLVPRYVRRAEAEVTRTAERFE